MKPFVQSLALFGLATAVSLLGVLLADHDGGSFRTASILDAPVRSLGFSSRYDLTRLELVGKTLDQIEVEYVDPGRIDLEAMFDGALDAMERRVPTVLARRAQDSAIVHLQVGPQPVQRELPPLEDPADLRKALQTVIEVVDEHVDPDDVRVQGSEDPRAAIEYALVNGMLDTLDPHSRLLPPEDSEEMDLENSGEFGGLGISILDRKGRLTIEYPMPDTPAARAGLRSGDRIVRIDGESTINMGLDEAVDRLRGPVGSPVVITVERENQADPLDVTIVRDRIKMNPVEGEVLDGGVGLVVVPAFHANVAADLEATLSRLARQVAGGRLKGLILDLRGNPGGYLNQAVAVADTFLEDGVIVSTMRRGKVDDHEEAEAPRTEPRYPLAVLIDASSASASEIVAGALRNNHRAVIIGERSFGKGSVQNLDNYFDGSKLKLTIAQYYTPGNKSIQAVGIPADFELVPAVVHEGSDADDPDTALLYWRERVRREADFDAALERQPTREEKPVWSLRYLRPEDLRRQDSSLAYLRRDPEVRFARDVLMAAGGRHRRDDVLAAGAAVVDSYRRQGERDLQAAFARLDVDWSAGPAVDTADLEVRLDLGEDGRVRAGETEEVRLRVTNRGDAPLHRVVAISESGSDVLDGREFFLGRIDPGETRGFAHRVSLAEGYPTEDTPLTFTFRGQDDLELLTWETHLPVEGRDLPRLAWRWRVDDAASGDGDGIPEVGEEVEIVLDVENVGDGPTAEAFARIRNRSRKALDIVRGTLDVGPMVTTDGAPCPVRVGGLDGGNVVTGPEESAEETAARIQAGKAPVWGEGCVRRLAPGATWTGRFRVSLVEARDPWELELSVGDADAYDYATVMRTGFYDTFANEVPVRFGGEDGASGDRHEPPVIEVSQRPDSVEPRGRVSLSGVVRDADGVAHVTIWRGEDKVGLATGPAAPSVPFGIDDIVLEPGLNTLSVVATDVEGVVSTRSVVVSHQPAAVQARAGARESAAPPE